MSLAAWLDKVDGGPEEAALRKLGNLPPYKHGRVEVPFPYCDREFVKQDIDNEEIKEAIEEAPIETVVLKHLNAIQHSVDPRHVAGYILKPDAVKPGTTNPKTGIPVDRVIVLRYQGHLFCWDGHHRISAARLLGEKTIEARVADLDKEVDDGEDG